jgi:tRNA-specific 2-thiouridylase
VVCNRFIKFGELWKEVKKLGCDYLATGHYARIAVEVRESLFSKTQAGKKGGLKNYSFLLSDLPTRPSEVKSNCNLTADQYFSKRTPSPLFRLLVARDKKKDQSYFLYRLNQEQLAHVLFPNGGYLKSEVREMARKWGLPVKDTRESQEICFLEGQDYREFLKVRIAGKIKPGEAVDVKGKLIGEHFGLPLYTIGQRSGFRIEHRAFGREKRKVPVLYVVEKDSKKNRLVVGRECEMQKKEFEVGELGLINPGVELAKFKKDVKVKLRSQGKLLDCRVFRLLKGKIRVCLEKPEMGLAAGQSAVFYRGYEALGGGVII